MSQLSLPPPTDVPFGTQAPMPTEPPAALVEHLAEALKPLREDLGKVAATMTDISRTTYGLTKSIHELGERIGSLEVAVKMLDPSARNEGDNYDHRYLLSGQPGPGVTVNNYDSIARPLPPTSTIGDSRPFSFNLGNPKEVPVFSSYQRPKDTVFHDAFETAERNRKRLEEAKRDIRKTIEERAVIRNHISFARTENGRARDDNDRLFPLRLQDGTMPEDIFPRTLGGFKMLPEDDLECLMALYNLTTDENIGWGVEQKRELVADHICVRLHQ